jgi:TPR repeat protein
MEALPSLLPAEATCSGGTWKACADAGDNEAQIMFGLLYSTGRRVGCDLLQAHQWVNLAVLAGAARDMSPA